MRPISIRRFPSELYKRVRMEAVKQDKSVKAIFIAALESYLKDRR
jgi:hypothetical protein